MDPTEAPKGFADIIPISTTPARRNRYVVPPAPLSEEADEAARLAGRVQIPASFAGVTWETLPALKGPEGRPSVAGGPRAIAAARAKLQGATKAVILGKSRAGKTCLAIAALEEQIRTGANRPRFVATTDLEEQGLEAMALTAGYLLLDDVGYELHGAESGTPLCAQRRKPVSMFMGKWARDRRPGVRLLVTTWMDFPEMALSYGHGVATRIYEGAIVVTL